jgi:hypothetical protein
LPIILAVSNEVLEETLSPSVISIILSVSDEVEVEEALSPSVVSMIFGVSGEEVEAALSPSVKRGVVSRILAFSDEEVATLSLGVVSIGLAAPAGEVSEAPTVSFTIVSPSSTSSTRTGSTKLSKYGRFQSEIAQHILHSHFGGIHSFPNMNE